MTEYGVDLSSWNAVADAAALARDGVTFAWCKATQGTGYTDPTFAAKVNQLRAAGLTVGAYHFLSGPDPVAQARHFAAVAGPAGCLAGGALVPMLDMEDASVRAAANTAVPAFVQTLGASMVGCYANLDWWTNVLRPGEWGAAPVVGHIARYNGLPGQPGWGYPQLALHQFSSTGHVPGIPGAVDRDATMPGWTLARLRLGSGPAPIPAPVAAPPVAVNSSEWVVVAGDTLSRIASAWGVSVSAVAAANGIPDPNEIYPKQVIHRPGAPLAGPLPVPSATGAGYVVQPGDTVSGIAVREHTTEAVLVALNHLANPDRIYPGQLLTLPGPAAAGGDHTYTVLPGDTLGVIAARLRYAGGWPALAAYNHLANPDRINVGQVLHY